MLKKHQDIQVCMFWFPVWQNKDITIMSIIPPHSDPATPWIKFTKGWQIYAAKQEVENV